MKPLATVCIVVTSFLLFSGNLWAQGQPWKIGTASLTNRSVAANSVNVSSLHVRATVAQTGQVAELSAPVFINRIDEAFIVNDKLAVVGHGDHFDGVFVFDLATQREIDRVACFQPRRISPDWIAYIEWYPRRTNGAPTDVILAYDLSLSPQANRMTKEDTLAGVEAPWDSIHRGFPLFPDSNVRQRSYDNVVPDVMQAQGVLGSPFMLLSSRKLVISVYEGVDARDFRSHLAIVDLSEGLSHPTIRRIALPTDKYPRRHQSPLSMEILRMEEVSPHEVRLFLPEKEYGVASIVVDVNR